MNRIFRFGSMSYALNYHGSKYVMIETMNIVRYGTYVMDLMLLDSIERAYSDKSRRRDFICVMVNR